MYNLQNVEKSGFRQPVYVSVCQSVCLSCCILFRKLSRAKGLTDRVETWGLFGYMGHCTVPIFGAIREPVYKII